MPTPPPPADDSEPIGGPVTDRWWWPGGLRLVGGGGIVAYQVPVLPDEAIFLNWVMVLVGVGIAAWGLQRLWQDYAIRRASIADRSTPGDVVPQDLPTGPDEGTPPA